MPVGVSSLRTWSKDLGIDRGPESQRDFTRLRLIIGRNRTEFDVRAELLDTYSPVFAQYPKFKQFTWPNLSPNGVRIALRVLADIDSSYGRLGAPDLDTFNHCFDVFHCANEWDIPRLKTHVYNVLSAGDLFNKIIDYEAFLNQIYQLFNMYNHQEVADKAITNCLRTIAEEHADLAPGLPIRGQPYGKELSSRDIQYDMLMTEYARVRKDCNCRFCSQQRKWKEAPKKPWFFMTYFSILKYEISRTSDTAWNMTRWFVNWLFTLGTLLTAILLVPLLGLAVLLNGITYVFGTVCGFCISIGIIIIAVNFLVFIWWATEVTNYFTANMRGVVTRLWTRMALLSLVFYGVVVLTAYYTVMRAHAALKESELLGWVLLKLHDCLEAGGGMNVWFIRGYKPEYVATPM
ncbi:hypothetical protein ABW20_dc0109677 [Dactylellina cionopaga]|nr:hypothetical protein ABW20_dc0109677 [Dactylellina cionopaga]